MHREKVRRTVWDLVHKSGQRLPAPSPAAEWPSLSQDRALVPHVPPPCTHHADELGQRQLQLDGDELRGAGSWPDQVVVAGFVQKVIHELLLRVGHAAIPWESTQSDLLAVQVMPTAADGREGDSCEGWGTRDQVLAAVPVLGTSGTAQQSSYGPLFLPPFPLTPSSKTRVFQLGLVHLQSPHPCSRLHPSTLVLTTLPGLLRTACQGRGLGKRDTQQTAPEQGKRRAVQKNY